MNFKPTLWKTIVSFLVGILVNYYLFKPFIICACSPLNPCYCPQPTWINYAFEPMAILFSLVSFGLVYLIWSLVQKKSMK